MDKKFASAEESDDDAEEAEMSVLSTFEQNETLGFRTKVAYDERSYGWRQLQQRTKTQRSVPF